MSNQNIANEWADVKTKIKAKWGKLMDTDVESAKDNMHLIVEKVQKVYGMTKDKAEQEFTDFKKSLESKAAPTTKLN